MDFFLFCLWIEFFYFYGGYMKTITKRDGRIASFDERKIYHAIQKAQLHSNLQDDEFAKKCTSEVVNHLCSLNKTSTTVENVQDVIENTLIMFGASEVAKNFILYRSERSRIRESKTRLMKSIYDITFKDAKDNDVKR